jgi:hypothetical protein
MAVPRLDVSLYGWPDWGHMISVDMGVQRTPFAGAASRQRRAFTHTPLRSSTVWMMASSRLHNFLQAITGFGGQWMQIPLETHFQEPAVANRPTAFAWHTVRVISGTIEFEEVAVHQFQVRFDVEHRPGDVPSLVAVRNTALG